MWHQQVKCSVMVYLIAVFGLGVTGCDTERPVSRTVVRDSAGVAIVENALDRPVWTEETAWRLAATPDISVGSAEGDSRYLIHRAIHARRLPDGSIAVANRGTSDVRVFGRDGRHLRTIGREGDGPGEFRSPWAVFGADGDSIVVVDLYRKVAVFGPNDGVREFVAGENEGEAPLDQFGDGSLLFMEYIPGQPSIAGEWRQVNLLRRDLSGNQPEHIRTVDEQKSSGSSEMNPFGPRGKMAAGQSSVWYSRGDALELKQVGLDGELVRIVRLPVAPDQVTGEHKNKAVENLLEQNPNLPREILDRIIRWPEFLPVHGAVIVDEGGNVWVEQYLPPKSDQDGRRWYVFDREGQYQGQVVVPQGLTLHQVADNWVLGIHQDELGVERLQLYEIEKPRG